ncbi:hypothetical protein [Aeromicrobium halocynthiae]|uniref:hypothetical protein n=1 Tax=Aeromicrobium halocynthiae TaxID=560557 RepID=UPI0031DE90EA
MLAVTALVAAVLLAATAGAATVSFNVTPTSGPGAVTIDWNVAPQEGRTIESITARSEPATDFAGPVEDAVGTLSINVPRSGTYTFTVEVLESGADERVVESRTVEVTSAAPPADEEKGEAQPETEPSPDPEATTGDDTDDQTPTRPTDIPDAGVAAGPTSTSRDNDGTAPVGPLRSAD